MQLEFHLIYSHQAHQESIFHIQKNLIKICYFIHLTKYSNHYAMSSIMLTQMSIELTQGTEHQKEIIVQGYQHMIRRQQPVTLDML